MVASSEPRPVTSVAIAPYDTASAPSPSRTRKLARYSWAGCWPAIGSTLSAVAVKSTTWSVPLGLSASPPMYSTAATGRKSASTRMRIRVALFTDFSGRIEPGGPEALGDQPEAQRQLPGRDGHCGHRGHRGVLADAAEQRGDDGGDEQRGPDESQPGNDPGDEPGP